MVISRTKNKQKQAINTEKKRIVLPYLQRIGKSLMFPIAILPFAAIFLRISELIPDDTTFSLVTKTILSTIGNAVFGPVLPIIFAIGISFGLSKDQRGEAAIVGFVVMMLIQSMLSINPVYDKDNNIKYFSGIIHNIYGKIDFGDYIIKNENSGDNIYDKVGGFLGLFRNKYESIIVHNIFNGMLVGILVSTIYNHFNGIELPSILAFFSGRRLIPVLGLIFGLIFGLLWALIFPWIGFSLNFLSIQMGKATNERWGNASIMGGYVFLNRMLIPFGLHHIPNTLFWFTLGEGINADNETIHGDIHIFLDGKVYYNGNWNNAGTFQSGFFPFMMFGLPALSFAFYRHAQNKEQAKRVATLLTGSSLVAFFTGITEPLEFSFMFTAPILYLFHGILAGIWAFVAGAFQIQLGFGFSAGFIDFVLSIPKSLEIVNAKLNGIPSENVKGIYSQFDATLANPFMLIPIGILCGISYYFVVKLAIKVFNVSTPGRGNNLLKNDDDSKEEIKIDGFKSNKYTADAIKIIQSIGLDNISNLEWCATRLRFTLVDNSKINEDVIKETMSRGQVKIGSTGYQIIIGPAVEMMGNEIQRVMKNPKVLEVNISNNANSSNKANVSNKNENKNSNEIIKLHSIGVGPVSQLESINDPVFSTKVMGDGVAIDCLDGKVYAPISGTLETVFPTGHAYGIRTEDGSSILIHIGVDTVQLDTSKIFNAKVEQGQKINQGDLLCEFDRDEIKNQNYEARVIYILTSDSEKQVIEKSSDKYVDLNDVIMTIG